MQTENGNEIPTFVTSGLKYIRSNIDSLSIQDKQNMYNTLRPAIIPMTSETIADYNKLNPFRIRIHRKKGE
jgi:hypothetical protein|nr:MAG TPA: hypothetical protein [Caudoviricetes sp.]